MKMQFCWWWCLNLLKASLYIPYHILLQNCSEKLELISGDNLYSLIQMKCQGGDKYVLPITVKNSISLLEDSVE